MTNSTQPWRFLSFALVAKDNPQGEEVISVWLAQLLPYEEGEVKDIKTDESTELVDISGVARKVSVNRSAVLEAKWYPTVDGRQTPPNVVNGETVEIYQYGVEDVYRWVSNGRQPNLRRLEHVTYAYSNLRDVKKREAFDGKSSYGWTYSTREKFVRFWTTTSDGEKHHYQFLIDTKESLYRLNDDKGNVFGIDSLEDDVFMRNAKGSFLRAFDKKIEGYSKEVIALKSKLIHVGRDMIVQQNLNVYNTIRCNTLFANAIYASYFPGGGISGNPEPPVDDKANEDSATYTPGGVTRSFTPSGGTSTSTQPQGRAMRAASALDSHPQELGVNGLLHWLFARVNSLENRVDTHDRIHDTSTSNPSVQEHGNIGDHHRWMNRNIG